MKFLRPRKLFSYLLNLGPSFKMTFYQLPLFKSMPKPLGPPP